jgi:integrase
MAEILLGKVCRPREWRGEAQVVARKQRKGIIMSLYRRGNIWWYRFEFQGSLIRESTGVTNKEAARAAEGKRHTALRESRAGVTPQLRVPLFSRAADDYVKIKKGEWAPNTLTIEQYNIGHLKPTFGGKLLTDIGPEDVAAYRDDRIAHAAAGKTVALELSTLRAILLSHDLDSVWRSIRRKVKLAKAEKVGRVIAAVEESTLLTECRQSRSRSLYVAVTLALWTCMRLSELRLLRWRQVDFDRRVITVGESKTEAGTGREIPLTSIAVEVLVSWARLFPNKKPNHYVFPSEHCGQSGAVYNTDPTTPIGSWKEAWEAAKIRAGVECRWHDIRHTGCTHLLDAGVPYAVVTEIMGWSASTAVRMIREVYGHVGPAARRRAMDQLEKFMEPMRVGTKSYTIEEPEIGTIQ